VATGLGELASANLDENFISDHLDSVGLERFVRRQRKHVASANIEERGVVRAFNRAFFEIDVARGERRLRVSAGVIGSIKAVIQTIERDRGRKIQPKRLTWFELFGFASLYQCHRELSSNLVWRLNLRISSVSLIFLAARPPEDIAQNAAGVDVERRRLGGLG
jgi:hypothetical protein